MKQKSGNRLKTVHFVPKRDLIAGACSSEPNGSIRFWSIDNGNLKEVLDLGRSDWATASAVSNSGDLIAVTFLGNEETGCYSLKEEKWLWKTSRVGKGVMGTVMRFTPDDRKLVVVGFRNIVTYDAQTGDVLQDQEDSKGFSDGFPKYRTKINGISSNARYAAFWQGSLEHDEGWWSSKNIWVIVRDIEKRKTLAKQGKIQDKYKNCSAVFTPDDESLLLGSMDGYIRVWSISGQKVIREWRAYWLDESLPFRRYPSTTAIHSMTFSPNGRYLATMGQLKGRSAVRIWDYAAKELVNEFDDVISSGLPMCSGYPMAFSPDGRYFAFEQQGKLCLYDTQAWQEKWSVFSYPDKKD